MTQLGGVSVNRKATTTSGISTRLLAAAGILILAIPVIRLLEAGLRFFFMKEHYGSFWESLKKDFWFSEGWVNYVITPLGLAMTLLPIACLAAAIVCLILAVRVKPEDDS